MNEHEALIFESVTALIEDYFAFAPEAQRLHAIAAVQELLQQVDFGEQEHYALQDLLYNTPAVCQGLGITDEATFRANRDILLYYVQTQASGVLIGVSFGDDFWVELTTDGSQPPLNSFGISYSTAYGTAPSPITRTSINTAWELIAEDLPVLSADNGTFKAWTLNGEAVSEGQAISGDVELVAVWEAVEQPEESEEVSVGRKYLLYELFGPEIARALSK